MPLIRLQAKKLQEMGSFDSGMPQTNQNNVRIKIGMQPTNENNVPYDNLLQPPPSLHTTPIPDQEVEDFLQDIGAMDILDRVLKSDLNRFMDHLIRLGATPTNTNTTPPVPQITITIPSNTTNKSTSISLPSNDPTSIAIISQLVSQQNVNTSNAATISISQDNQNPNL